jgi:hypothetical protein
MRLCGSPIQAAIFGLEFQRRRPFFWLGFALLESRYGFVFFSLFWGFPFDLIPECRFIVQALLRRLLAWSQRSLDRVLYMMSLGAQCSTRTKRVIDARSQTNLGGTGTLSVAEVSSISSNVPLVKTSDECPRWCELYYENWQHGHHCVCAMGEPFEVVWIGAVNDSN